MQVIKVERNVPIAPLRRNLRYPFGEMKVGDSFEMIGKDIGQKIRSAAVMYAKRMTPKQTFSVRKTIRGYRCWRIK